MKKIALEKFLYGITLLTVLAVVGHCKEQKKKEDAARALEINKEDAARYLESNKVEIFLERYKKNLHDTFVDSREEKSLKEAIRKNAEVNQDFAKRIAARFYPQFEELIKYYERRNSVNPYNDALSTFELNWGENITSFVKETHDKSPKNGNKK